MTTKVAPTTSEQWLERTSLLLDVQVDSVLAERPEARRRLTPNQIDWFYNHVDQAFPLPPRSRPEVAQVERGS